MVTHAPSRANGQDDYYDERVATATNHSVAEQIAYRLRDKGLSVWIRDRVA
jgi:hypothetical protein